MGRIFKRGRHWSSNIKREGGKRSGLEVQVASQLVVAKVEYKYETENERIPYTDPKTHTYLPDFRLANGIYVECKGWFKAEDRKKHLLIKYQHPELDIRFIFSNPNSRLSKKSKTTYADWCVKNGFKFAKGIIPTEWLNAKTTHA